jgi:heme exporter protein B
MTRALASLLLREARLATRVGGGAMMGAIFFLAVVVIVPFGVGPDLALLRRIGPAILWLGALLATLLGLDRLFQADHEDGSLDLLHLGPVPLEATVAVKALAHWATTGLPLVVATPFLGLLVNLPPAGIGAVTASLAIGTPALTFLGAVGAALTVALRRGGLLVPILILPLAIPVLIFGVAAANAATNGIDPLGPPLLVLAALTLFSAVLGVVAGGAALRLALE